jgi:predicted Rossmann-fold nucleotide-binding protein
MPGGFGTMDEFFETLTLAQTTVINDFPIVLYGKAYYAPLLTAIDEMQKKGTIGEKDKKLILLTDDMDEAMEHIRTYISHHFRVKPRRRLWWLFEKR